MTFDYDYSTSGQIPQGLSTGWLIGCLIIGVLAIVVMWRIFSKAGEAGWKSIIPIYNIVTSFKLFWANCNPILMTVLCLVPLVNCVIMLILTYKMCASFGKGVGFFILTLFFAPITMLILAFGSSEYIGAQ